MDHQTLGNIQQNIVASNIKPIFADEIVVVQTIKANKTKDNKITKEGHLHMLFIDMATQKPVERVVISPITAAGLVKALTDSLAKLDNDMKSKKIEKTRKTSDVDYIR